MFFFFLLCSVLIRFSMAPPAPLKISTYGFCGCGAVRAVCTVSGCINKAFFFAGFQGVSGYWPGVEGLVQVLKTHRRLRPPLVALNGSCCPEQQSDGRRMKQWNVTCKPQYAAAVLTPLSYTDISPPLFSTICILCKARKLKTYWARLHFISYLRCEQVHIPLSFISFCISYYTMSFWKLNTVCSSIPKAQ